MLKDDIVNMLKLDYTQCVEFLIQKYGSCSYDYFRTQSCKTLNDKADRSNEGLFIHHIDSNRYNGLSSKHVALNYPFSAQKADRLVYCNYLEQLILHIKIFEDWLAERCPQIGLGAVLIIMPELDKFYRTGHFTKAKQQIYADAIKDGIEEYKLILQHLSNLASNGKVDESILQEINKYVRLAMITNHSPIALANNASVCDPELINKIKNHKLGNRKDAFDLYNSLCDLLKEKYGPVDKDYDENPTKRGKEWLDIHHIREYELDDIARRTASALDVNRRIKKAGTNVVVVSKEQILIEDGNMGVALVSTPLWNEIHTKGDSQRIYDRLKELFPNVSGYSITGALDYSLEDLKPYNVKEQLVYANKIEHFLLHYLIDSIRGQDIFSGGPNYLWDECIALDYYGFEQEYMNNIKSQKDFYYSLMSSEEITLLYKKLIDWKNWDIGKCGRHWHTINYMIRYLDERQVSYVEDTEKFFQLLDILGCGLRDEITTKILSLPYKARIIDWGGMKLKVIKNHVYSMDEKTLFMYYVPYWRLNSMTVSSGVEKIDEGAFRCGFWVEKITIPTSVKQIANKAFTVHSFGAHKEQIWEHAGIIPVTNQEFDNKIFTDYYNIHKGQCLPHLKTVVYKGSRAMWNEKFSNVELNGITLVCKK